MRTLNQDESTAYVNFKLTRRVKTFIPGGVPLAQFQAIRGTARQTNPHFRALDRPKRRI